jgi:hypothetical protein
MEVDLPSGVARRMVGWSAMVLENAVMKSIL